MKRLGNYEVLGEVGRGGMGIVYLARNKFLERFVALKSMSSSPTGNPNLLQAFYDEARLVSSLHHPNIVKIYDVGDEASLPFIVMEFMDGQNLDDIIASGTKLPLSLKLTYAIQACRAFDYAHKRGIIHRDIKPSNVIVNKAGTVTVVDFGLARVVGMADPRTGALIGTCPYMAPEVYEKRSADERSDIWSFGVLLYELLAYRRPFSAESLTDLMQSICLKEPIPIAQLVPDCPLGLQLLVQRMLRKSEVERFSKMEDVLLELDSICKPLQTEELGKLFEQGQQLVEQGQCEQASYALLAAIQIENSIKPKGDYTKTPIRVLYEKVRSNIDPEERKELKQDWPDSKLKILRNTLLSGTLEDNTLGCSLDELITNLGLDPLDPAIALFIKKSKSGE